MVEDQEKNMQELKLRGDKLADLLGELVRKVDVTGPALDKETCYSVFYCALLFL